MNKEHVGEIKVSDFDSFENLVYGQAASDLEWTVEYWPCRFMFPTGIVQAIQRALSEDVLFRLTGNLDADL
jgi:hypothetical protein